MALKQAQKSIIIKFVKVPATRFDLQILSEKRLQNTHRNNFQRKIAIRIILGIANSPTHILFSADIQRVSRARRRGVRRGRLSPDIFAVDIIEIKIAHAEETPINFAYRSGRSGLSQIFLCDCQFLFSVQFFVVCLLSSLHTTEVCVKIHVFC